MKNLHLLPSNKPSRLVLDTVNNNLFITTTKDFGTNIMQFQNIYITSNEIIKEGDWQLSNDKHITIRTNSFHESDKKIVLTTDEELVNDGIQSISDDFLQWFIKNPSCEYVPIIPPLFGHTYIIWIEGLNFIEEPKALTKLEIAKNIAAIGIGKEKPKQETLEEAVKREFETRKYNSDFPFEPQSFKLGAKWQSERMYSEEDVRKISVDFFYHWWNAKGNNTEEGFNDWFEQFKKK